MYPSADRKRDDAAAGPGVQHDDREGAGCSRANTATRSYWDWHDMIAINKHGTFPYTPAINLLFALREAHHDAG